MLNSWRILWALVVYGVQIIAWTSPNTGKEMGTQSGDKIAQDGMVGNFFLRLILMVTIYSYYVFTMIVNHGEDSITVYDSILIGTTIAGFVLRMWCYWSLGNHFTFILGTRQNHQLIKTGPYRYLIHPSYTGQLMSMLGSLVFLGSSWLAMISLIYSHFVVQKRIRVEEEMMEKQFGDQYRDYKGSRARFIPFIY